MNDIIENLRNASQFAKRTNRHSLSPFGMADLLDEASAEIDKLRQEAHVDSKAIKEEIAYSSLLRTCIAELESELGLNQTPITEEVKP